MKITKIKKQKNNPNRFNIHIDNKFAFGLSQDSIIKTGLKLNQEISPTELKKIKKQVGYDQAWQKSLNYLSFRPRSEKEINDYLSKKDIQPDVIDQTIEKLKKINQINDLEFAEIWLQDRKQKLKGPRVVKSELILKGIDQNQIDQLIENKYDSRTELSIIKKLINKKKKSFLLNKNPSYKEKARISQFLVRRGFNYDIINSVIKK